MVDGAVINNYKGENGVKKMNESERNIKKQMAEGCAVKLTEESLEKVNAGLMGPYVIGAHAEGSREKQSARVGK